MEVVIIYISSITTVSQSFYDLAFTIDGDVGSPHENRALELFTGASSAVLSFSLSSTVHIQSRNM